MSREAFGDPPEQQSPRCPVCDGTEHTTGCELGEEMAKRRQCERELAEWRELALSQAGDAGIVARMVQAETEVSLLHAAMRDEMGEVPLQRQVRPGAEAFLTPQDMEDLRRLEDLFSDDQGWDLPKERMRRLAELGAIRRTTRDHYCLTAFGRWCIGEWHGLPLKTWQEQCDEAQREHMARVGA